MKRFISLLCIVFFSTQYVLARRVYDFNFDINDFSLSETDGKIMISAKDEFQYFYGEDSSLPALPYRTLNILLPPFSNISDLQYKTEVFTIEQGITVADNPKVYSTNQSMPATGKLTAHYKEGIYPSSNLEHTFTSSLNGFRIAGFKITPFIYDSQQGSLSFITHISISFDVKENDVIRASYKGYKPYASTLIKNLVENPEEMEFLYNKNESVRSASSNNDDIDYLIITADSLVDSFKPLRDWKRQKGLRAEIMSLSEIYNNFSWAGNDSCLIIKTGLWYIYTYQNLKWVLLGGDDIIIPVRMCYGSNAGVEESIPCDLYYSSLESSSGIFNWDKDGDGIYGELEDSVNLYSSIFLSRLPIRNRAQAANFVNKTISYEQNPLIQRIDKMLMTGVILAQNISYLGNISDSQAHSQLIYDTFINNSNTEWNGELTRFFDTYTDISNDSQYDVTAQHLKDQLNNNYHFVHMSTHGWQRTWDMENNPPYFTSSDALSLTNIFPSIVLTTACYTNAFDYIYDPCLGEALIRNPQGGSVACWASSRNGWSNAYPQITKSYKFNANFYSYLFNNTENNNCPNLLRGRFAFLTNMSKHSNLGNTSYYGGDRWLQFSLIAFGDPELPIYTDTPSLFSSVSISHNGSNVTVNTGGVQNCTIALTSIDPADNYFAVFDSVSTATFNDVLCPYNLVITKHNYIPYRYCQPDVYIQNVTFDSNVHVKGRNIYVGRSVIPSSVEGNVLVNPGNSIIFEAEQNVYIKDGFILGTGSKFEIK